jgi:SAM-dependent methyltransferase
MPQSSGSRRLDAATLERALARPERFAPHDAPFWDDPHIGRQMLAAHLDPETDAASRRPDVIARTVAHLVGALHLGAGDHLLDLGCGPGLYATAFAGHGLAVSGIDLSPTSVAYAVEAARRAHLAIDYRVGDYTTDPLGGPFDAAVLIYLDFGVLPDEPRNRLLDGVRVALRPGGLFAFDVHAPARERVTDAAITVQRSEGGFWRPGPHLVLETSYRYEDSLDLNQYAIVEAGSITTYRVWDRAYSLTQLRALLRRHGFAIEAAWSDLAGAPFRRSSETVGVVARRLPARGRSRPEPLG